MYLMPVIRLFVLAYDNTEDKNQVSVDSFANYFLPTAKIEDCNFEIDERNFYDQPVNALINQYNEVEVKKVSTGQGDDYRTGCLLDFAYFKNNYRLIIAANLSKQKALDADSRVI